MWERPVYWSHYDNGNSSASILHNLRDIKIEARFRKLGMVEYPHEKLASRDEIISLVESDENIKSCLKLSMGGEEIFEHNHIIYMRLNSLLPDDLRIPI